MSTWGSCCSLTLMQWMVSKNGIQLYPNANNRIFEVLSFLNSSIRSDVFISFFKLFPWSFPAVNCLHEVVVWLCQLNLGLGPEIVLHKSQKPTFLAPLANISKCILFFFSVWALELAHSLLLFKCLGCFHYLLASCSLCSSKQSSVKHRYLHFARQHTVLNVSLSRH